LNDELFFFLAQCRFTALLKYIKLW